MTFTEARLAFFNSVKSNMFSQKKTPMLIHPDQEKREEREFLFLCSSTYLHFLLVPLVSILNVCNGPVTMFGFLILQHICDVLDGNDQRVMAEPACSLAYNQTSRLGYSIVFIILAARYIWHEPQTADGTSKYTVWI